MEKAILILLILAFSFATMGPGFSQEFRHRSFTKEEIDTMKNTKAIIHTIFGDITLRFFPEVAPNHVDNFISLAENGFYNGTIFHRVIPGFMIQGGDPNSRNDDKTQHGTGNPGYFLKAEFSDMPHKRGTLSMARAQHPDSAGSQFFICTDDSFHLDRKYTVFGEVTSGMDIVDKIVYEPRDKRDSPVKRVEIMVEIIRPKSH